MFVLCIFVKLARGSYGQVYRAVRNSDGKSYAIKELNLSHMSAKEKTEAVNEVRLLASIRHRNIIRYCEAFLERDCMYIVTELAQTDLDAKLNNHKRNNTRMSEDEVWETFIQVAVAMKAMHDHNIVHRVSNEEQEERREGR
jgi:NIMA (never in mitosis gene a)-related kinase